MIFLSEKWNKKFFKIKTMCDTVLNVFGKAGELASISKNSFHLISTSNCAKKILLNWLDYFFKITGGKSYSGNFLSLLAAFSRIRF